MHESHPICLNVLDVDYSNEFPSFIKIETIIFLGNQVPKDIRKHITQYNPEKSPPFLKKYYGPHWRRYLHITDSIKKGGYNNEDMFEDLTFDELIQTSIERHVPTTKPPTMKQKIKEIITYDFNLAFFEKDDIQTVKEKIALYTNIPYFKQHMFFKSITSDMNFTVGYDMMVDGNKYDIDITKVDFSDLASTLLNLPIDRYMYTVYESTSVHSYEVTTELSYYTDMDPYGEFNIISIDSFILNQNLKDSIQHLIKIDKEQYYLIYYSFVYKYFPVFTESVFFEYITNESSILDIYPDIAIPKDQLQKRYITERSTLQSLDSVSERDLQKNQEYFKTKINKISIRSNIIYSDDILNIRTLFNNIQLDSIPMINFIEMVSTIDQRNAIITKVNTVNSVRYTHPYSEQNTLFLSVFVIDEKNEIFKFSNVYLNIVLDSKGIIKAYIQFPSIILLSKLKFTKLIIEKINPIVQKLNMISIAFNSSHRILPIAEDSIVYMDSSISLIYNKMISLSHLERIFERLIDANIFQFKSSMEEHEYMLHKGIFSYNLSKLNTIYYDVQNHYSRFSDLQFKNMWNHLFSNKTIVIKYNIIHTVFELNNITMDETEYIKNLLNRILVFYEKELQLTKTEPIKVDTISSLKSIDPKLFNFKARSNYSRVCQKKFQPKIVTMEEIRKQKLSNVVKYWNFTKNKEEYYYCPYAKNKYVGFITNIHPNKYCLPCCKKIHREDQKFKSCINDHIVTEEPKSKQISRYIPKYTCSGDIENRLSKLPDSLSKIFNEQQSDNMYIYGFIPQKIKTISSIGMIYVFADVLGLDFQEYILLMIRYLKETPTIFQLLFYGDAPFPFESLHVLIKEIVYRFTTAKPYISEFNVNWNDIFISIMYHYGYNTIIFEDKATAGGSEKIEMILHQFQSSKEIILKNPNTVLIFRKPNEEKNNYTYFPLYIINKQKYFSNNEIQQKSIAQTHPLHFVIENIIQVHFSQIDKMGFKTLNLLNVIRFAEFSETYQLTDLYIHENTCYAIGMYIHSNYLYLSIHNSNIETVDIKSYTLCHAPLDLNKYKMQMKLILDFVGQYNKYVLHYATKTMNTQIMQDTLNSYKTYNHTYNQSFIYQPQYTQFDIDEPEFPLDFIYIDTFIVLQNMIIGLSHNNLITYIQPPISLSTAKTILLSNIQKTRKDILCKTNKNTENLLCRIFNLSKNITHTIPLTSLPSIPEEYKVYFRELLYHPMKINTYLESNKNISFLDKKRITLFRRSIYRRYIYKIFIYLFIHSMKIKENKKIRMDIIQFIKKLKKEQFIRLIDYTSTIYSIKLYNIIQSHIKKEHKLDDFLLKYISETSLRELIHLIQINKIDILSNYKKIESFIKTLISNNEFLFDMVTLEEIKYMELHDLRNIIEKYTKMHIHFANSIPSFPIQDIQYPEEKIMSREESIFFHNKKLILTKKDYSEFIDILAFDISNPFKRNTILSNLFFTTSFHNLIFHQFKNEKIFINYL